MIVKMIDMQDDSILFEKEFCNMEETNKFIEFCNEYGVDVEGEPCDYQIVFDAKAGAVLIHIEG